MAGIVADRMTAPAAHDLGFAFMMALCADDGMPPLIIGTQCHHESRSDEIMRRRRSHAP